MRHSRSYNHEHGFDCVQFFELAAPHRWSAIQDFMRDRTAPLRVCFEQDPTVHVCGTCGLPPDAVLMQKEGIDWLDEIGDRRGWDGETRLNYRDIYGRMHLVKRLQWLDDCVREYPKTGCLPRGMTEAEQQWVMSEIKRIASRKGCHKQKERPLGPLVGRFA